MNTPTHDEIATKAAQLWKDRGCPEGIDNAIWLEAEQQLKAGPAPGGGRDQSFVERAKEETAAESVVEYHITPPVSEQAAIKAALPGGKAPKRR